MNMSSSKGVSSLEHPKTQQTHPVRSAVIEPPLASEPALRGKPVGSSLSLLPDVPSLPNEPWLKKGSSYLSEHSLLDGSLVVNERALTSQQEYGLVGLGVKVRGMCKQSP